MAVSVFELLKLKTAGLRSFDPVVGADNPASQTGYGQPQAGLEAAKYVLLHPTMGTLPPHPQSCPSRGFKGGGGGWWWAAAGVGGGWWHPPLEGGDPHFWTSKS